MTSFDPLNYGLNFPHRPCVKLNMGPYGRHAEHSIKKSYKIKKRSQVKFLWVSQSKQPTKAGKNSKIIFSPQKYFLGGHEKAIFL